MPILWVALMMMLFFSFFRGNTSSEVLNISYSDFRKYVNDGQVAQVTFEGDQLTGQFKKPVKKGTG
ncbi:MAG: ATP-dependent metallopeptidase FtsH/Yme1/Tma family protein [Deltaproteobacteria bacterium]